MPICFSLSVTSRALSSSTDSTVECRPTVVEMMNHLCFVERHAALNEPVVSDRRPNRVPSRVQPSVSSWPSVANTTEVARHIKHALERNAPWIYVAALSGGRSSINTGARE